MMRILELFAGLGGVTRGFLIALNELNISFEYYAIEVRKDIVLCRQKLFPNITNILDDALNWLDRVNDFDFVWASPPCQAYSRAKKEARNGVFRDDILFRVYNALRRSKTYWIIENVVPGNKKFYRYMPKWDYKFCRHVFWTNIPIRGSRVKCTRRDKALYELSIEELRQFHKIPKWCLNFILGKDRRRVLRDMLDPILSYTLAKEILAFITHKTTLYSFLD